MRTVVRTCMYATLRYDNITIRDIFAEHTTSHDLWQRTKPKTTNVLLMNRNTI